MATDTAAHLLPVVTRQRLLEAAGEIFAELGFHKATVRDICKRAQANIAAVNYYFRDKHNLYTQVLLHAQRCAIEQYPLHMDLTSPATPQERLLAMVKAFLLRLLDPNRPAWQAKLMTRELTDPGPAFDQLVEQNIRPQFQLLLNLVRELTGPSATEEEVHDVAKSIISQCLFYRFARYVVAKLEPPITFTPPVIDRLARHITRFSLAGLSAIKPAVPEGVSCSA